LLGQRGSRPATATRRGAATSHIAIAAKTRAKADARIKSSTSIARLETSEKAAKSVTLQISARQT
jgi:hypothetical protein